MKLYKLVFASLILSLAVLTGVIFQQTTFADEEGLACADLAGCNAGPTCGGTGTQRPYCTIECSNQSYVTCPRSQND
jgi:hypothetical protein